jgi:hypothetical protein
MGAAAFREQIDFWALVTSKYFVGSESNALARSACYTRRAWQRRCDNFDSEALP